MWMVESRTRWEVRRNCRRFFEILSLYGLFVCSFVLLVVWVPRKFTLEEADKTSIASLLHPTPDVKPWIWAADLNHDWVMGDVPPTAVTPTDIYPGYFRVSLEAVIPELWPLLMGTGISGLELWDLEGTVCEGP
jgi:hypothetical protein